MISPRDSLSGGLPWPEEYARLLPVLQDEWGVKDGILLTRELSGGKSGALVFFADVATKSFTGQAILKLDHAPNAAIKEHTEATRLDKAIADAPGFAARHLPRIIHTSRKGEQIGILSTIAGSGLEYIESWNDCSYERKLESAKHVSSRLLESWNSDYRLTPGVISPQELLRSWLGYRLDPEAGGRIHGLLGEDFGVFPGEMSFVVDGSWFPNPLAFARSTTLPAHRVNLRSALGHCHGDLHGLNLLLSRKEAKRAEYHLIDLAHYESEQYLFYDHAYFEVHTLLAECEASSNKDWVSTISQLSSFWSIDDVGELRTDHIGVVQLIQSIRQGVTDWINKHEPDRRSFMESQVLLARVATGLVFAHRHKSLESRQRAFFYAAASLKDYLKLHRLEWPKTGPSLILGAKAASPADGWSPASALRNQAVVRQFAAGSLAVLLIVLAALFVSEVRTLRGAGGSQGGPPNLSALNAATLSSTSLAVLPFENTNLEGDEGFVDGLSIDLASIFERSGAFRMPGMSSSFKFKDHEGNYRDVAEALDVDYLVTGTVGRNGRHLVIDARLVRGQDNTVIWSERLRSTMANLFSAQERVAEAVGAALATPIDIDPAELEAQRAGDPRAYELFVRGLALFEQRGRSLVRAIRSFHRATEISPDFAAAWGALSLAYSKVPNFLQEIDGRPVSPVAYYRRATEAAIRGQTIDPNVPLVRHAVALRNQRDRQWAIAEAEYEAVIRDDPIDSQVKVDYARLLYIVGRRAESLDWLEQAHELEPLVPYYQLWATVSRLQLDPTDENFNELVDIFRSSPNLREFALRYIIDYLAKTQQLPEARELIDSCSTCSVALRNRVLSMLEAASTQTAEAFFEQYKDNNILGYELLYHIGGVELTLDAFRYYALDSKRRYGFHMVPWVRIGSLVGHERFMEIAEEIGLVTYWREHGPPDACILKNNRLVCADEGA
ncbi:MAG: hypothetical protein AAGF48_10365 [Pseudomonadota bacterium]